MTAGNPSSTIPVVSFATRANEIRKRYALENPVSVNDIMLLVSFAVRFRWDASEKLKLKCRSLAFTAHGKIFFNPRQSEK